MMRLKWESANKGAKSLISHVRKHHSDPSKMLIVILHFNHQAHFIYEGTLDQDIPQEIFEGETRGGTYYGPIYEMAFDKIRAVV